jgi:hypothetical protein
MKDKRKEEGGRRKEVGGLLFTLHSLLFTLFSLGLGQTNASPESLADEAIQNWLQTKRPEMNVLMTKTPSEICTELPGFLNSPPENTKVNLQDRKELESPDATLKKFSYPAELPSGQLSIVEVNLRQNENTWEIEKVGFLPQRVSGRAWLQEPITGYIFAGFSLYILFLLLRPSSFLRRWLRAGWQVIKEHRRLVIGTMIALYALFGLGVLTGTQLPVECDQSILEIISTAVSSVGATDAYGSGNVARAAVVTFYQNFVSVTLFFLFGTGLIFGVLAYLLSGLSFYAQGIPFGLLADGGLGQLIFVLILLFLELTAYFLVVAGGGMILMTVIRKGLKGFNEGVRKSALMLPFAALLLLLGAWYEAGIIILPEKINQPAPSAILEQHPVNFAELKIAELDDQ